MIEPRNYPDFMELDDEREREDEQRALGYPPPARLTDAQRVVLREAYTRRTREYAATQAESHRCYLLTGKGRVAAERVDAAARAQLEKTKEIA